MKEQPIKGWVKASELPKESGLYVCRCIKKKNGVTSDMVTYGEYRSTFSKVKVDAELYGDVVEWLDESETPIQSGEERLFTLKEALDIWEHSKQYEYSEHFGPVPNMWLNKKEFFKQTFNIDLLLSEQ